MKREGMVLTHRVKDESDPETRPLDLGLMARLWAFTRPHTRKRNALILVSLVRALQLPLVVWAMGRVISGPISRHDWPGVVAGVACFLVIDWTTALLFHFRQRWALELGEAVVHDLRGAIFRHLLRMPMAFFHRMKLGRVISRMTSDVDAVRSGIQDVVFVSGIQLGQMVVAAGMMAVLDWPLFLVVLVMAPVVWGIDRHFRRRMSHWGRATQESYSSITATLAESVGGIRVTQGFARQDVNAGLFRRLAADHGRNVMELSRASAAFGPLLELNTQFFIASLLLLGGWQVLGPSGTRDVGDLIQFFFLANLFFGPIQIIGAQYNQALVCMAGAERVFRLLDLKPEWEDAPDARPMEERVPARRGWGVEFRDVTFAYDAGRPVLHGISFEVGAGQSVALVGHTGSGKSSIINLVTKFYLPTSGRVLIDGRDLAGVTGDSLHRRMGLVPQQNFLFSGTVLENIRLGSEGASAEEARAALRALGCEEVFAALPDGLETPVGERGGNLSLGQRQLVCFARAMVANPALVILDEATSSVDPLTEAVIQRALEVLLAGRTSFIVAHRLSTIRKADLILVLDQGRIVERGRHAELLAANGTYAQLHRRFIEQGAA
jgi:ATP-binding cassette subfamily B protein